MKRIIIFLAIALTGCVHEANYHGVPAPIWQKLSPEQRQLIVDKSYYEEFEKDNDNSKEKLLTK